MMPLKHLQHTVGGVTKVLIAYRGGTLTAQSAVCQPHAVAMASVNKNCKSRYKVEEYKGLKYEREAQNIEDQIRWRLGRIKCNIVAKEDYKRL